MSVVIFVAIDEKCSFDSGAVAEVLVVVSALVVLRGNVDEDVGVLSIPTEKYG